MKSDKKYLILSIAAVLLVWEGASLLTAGKKPLPGPLDTAEAVLAVLIDPSFLKTVGITLLRALAGFAVAITAGGILGIAAGKSPAFHSFMKPWLVLVRSTPVVVFVLLAVVWFSANTVPVLIGMLMMLPVVYLNVSEGILSIDPSIVQMARFYGIKGKRLLREIYLPAIRPFAMSGISNAVGLGWRAIVAAEVLCLPDWGIGPAMHGAQILGKVDVLMAWAVVTVLFAAVFEKLLSYGYRSRKTR